MKRILNVEAVRELASKVESWRSLRLACGLSHKGHIKAFCLRHRIDTSHFLADLAIKPTKDLADYLVRGRVVSSSYLKKRLLKAGVKKPICERCNRTEWEGSPIPLDLHHVDGDRANNLLENVQLLCCNCHALTPNYCGANAKRSPTRRTPEEYRDAIVSSASPKEACVKLGINPAGGNITTLKSRAARYGLSFLPAPEQELTCAADIWIDRPVSERKKRHRERKPRQPSAHDLIPSEELARVIWEMPLEKVGERYGVTGNAVKRWCRKRNLTLPPAGYWVRRRAGYAHEQALVTQKRVRVRLNQPSEEQAREAHRLMQEGHSLRKASQSIGFHHETAKAAMVRLGLLPKAPTRYERRKMAVS